MSPHHAGLEGTEQDRAAARRFLDETFGQAKEAFPQGKISDDDQGETAFAIAADRAKGCVIIQFTHPIVWLGLPKAEATHLRDILTKKIEELP